MTLVVRQGPPGPPGPPGAPGLGAEAIIFQFVVPTDTWVIDHNLETFPSVTTVDDTNSVILGDIEFTDLNRITVRFSEPMSGQAFLN